MHPAEAKLSRLQRDILRVLLAHLGAERAKSDRHRREAEAFGIPVKAIRRPRPSGADRAAYSRSLLRLERRGLVIRSNSSTGLPAGHPRARLIRTSADEPAPRKTDHVILTPAGEGLAKRLT
jgi:hypothetical protein